MYYVVGEGGAKYGPADLDTLRQWVAEHRLTASMTLEDAATGVQLPADQIPGLFPAAPLQPIQQTPTQDPAPYQSPQQPYQSPGQPQNPYSSSQGPGPFSQNPYQTPANYQRGPGDSGANNTIITGWVMFALGVACCFLFSPAAIFFGKKAKDEGHPQGNLVMILGIVWTCLGACGTILWIVGIAVSGASGSF